MTDIPILLTARTSSSRLPDKVLLRLHQHSVIVHALRRGTGTGRPVILCTTNHPSDDRLAHVAEGEGFGVFRGEASNKLKRWSDAANWLGIDYAHVLDADDPFFDVDEINDSIGLMERTGACLVHTSLRSDAGMGSVGTSFDVSFLHELANRSGKLRHADLDVVPWSHILSSEDGALRMPDRSLGALDSPVRLTLDYPEDLIVLRNIARNVSVEASRLIVEMWVKENPHVATLNQHRTHDFLNRQQRQRSSFD